MGRTKKQAHDEDTDLTLEQIEELRKVLEQTEARILAKAEDGLQLSMNRDLDRGKDSIDESTDEELLSTELRLRDREKKLLAKVRTAMERLEEGTINICEDCGGPIGFRRLLVRPVTTLCIDCKEAREANERMLESIRKTSGGLSAETTVSEDEL